MQKGVFPCVSLYLGTVFPGKTFLKLRAKRNPFTP